VEHRLIQGGEIYLPFARSCVAKLKKLGLPYADQSYEVDGASIKVRIEPGHEYIRINGGTPPYVPMDSGVVVFGYPAIGWKGRDDPGALVDTAKVTAYTASFVTTPGSGVVRTKPGTTSDGQFAGFLYYAKSVFKGKINYDPDMAQWFPTIAGPIPANCLSPKWEKVTDQFGVTIKRPLGAVHIVDDYADPDLITKKLYMLSCPASVFTGRTRLYVQAMYGTPIREYKSLKSGGERASTRQNTPITGMITAHAAPSLKVRAYVAPDDYKVVDGKTTAELNTYPDVNLTTSSGVYLDVLTGKHYLINIAGMSTETTLVTYPLVSSRGCEAYRKYLVTSGPLVQEVMLSETDRENLEAYILAWSLPDVKNAYSGASLDGSGNYSMGYGWHWNWDGTRADIVINETKDYGGVAPHGRMLSTHYGLEIIVQWDEVQRVDPSLYVRTPTAEWAVERAWFPIMEPNYTPSVNFLEKITGQRTTWLDSTAPFYAFYVKNQLNVCTITNETKVYPGIRTMSPYFASSLTPGANDINYVTYPEDYSFLSEMFSSPSYRSTTFHVGGNSSGELILSRAVTGRECRAHCTNLNIEAGPRWNAEPYWTGSFTYGDRNGSTTITVEEQSIYENGWFTLWSWYREYWDTTTYVSSEAEVVVPFFDSQAVYLDYRTTTTVVNSAKNKRANQSSTSFYAGWLSRTYYTPYSTGVRMGPYDSLTAGSMPPFNDDIVTDVDMPDDVTTTDTKALICIAGKINHGAIASGFGLAHDNLSDYVECQLDTRSGTATTEPTVASQLTNTYVGVDAWFASTVGWV